MVWDTGVLCHSGADALVSMADSRGSVLAVGFEVETLRNVRLFLNKEVLSV